MTINQKVRIPVGIDENGYVMDAEIVLPVPMTEGQWQQMHTVLDAMKPVIVPELAKAFSYCSRGPCCLSDGHVGPCKQ